ncbi:putative integral membrane protein [Babesia bovis T2Bo]|uniref:Uncharacterized protein n=1 Tax=Babesia bovis TaxID=5865 RepID=S6B2X1_BABBO|nr:putative integral membrane protein [Babesia bovis T2Bo]KAG6440221.1 putative integral membrane protein [Babesia bovis T2Bo]BAN65698.1 hypothetical protein [Babesia bovis]
MVACGCIPSIVCTCVLQFHFYSLRIKQTQVYILQYASILIFTIYMLNFISIKAILLFA